MLAVLVLLLAVAEPPTIPGHGARVTSVTSPEVDRDGMVTFRLRAPRAKEVLVKGVGAPLLLTRDVGGTWSGRTGPLAPGIYEYGFVVDGLGLPDPGNPWVKPSRWSNVSVIEIPGGRQGHEDLGHPRGAVTVHEYRSRNGLRRLNVYTPPGYERGGTFPSAYLLHGMSDTGATWSVFGRANVILDNAIAERRLPPTILVMPDGQPLEGAANAEMRAYLVANADALAAELRDEIIPLVERVYRVRKGRGGRAAIGFAMGAHQALVCAPQFHAVASITPPFLPAKVALSPKDLMLFRMPADHSELSALQALASGLAAQRVAVSVQLRPEPGHWPQWRKDLAELLPRLVARR